MSRRVESEIPPQTVATGPAAPAIPASVAAIGADADDRYGGHALPADHPPWLKDTVSVSQRARALFATLKPIVVVVLEYWHHRVRSIALGNQRLSIDTSGSYRLQ